MIVIRGLEGQEEMFKRLILATISGAKTETPTNSKIEIVKPAPISNQTCRLCKKKEGCLPYRFLGYILCTDSRFVESKDHDDLFLHLGELCKKHEFIEGQEG